MTNAPANHTTPTTSSPRIFIFGAGSIGCYVGGHLLAAGADLHLIGRERLRKTLEKSPLCVSDYLGYQQQITLPAERFHLTAEEACNADLVLVTVKSAATGEAGDILAPVLRPGTLVISLQNGISNADTLRRKLPQCTVLAGMVPFNVLQQSPGHFHQGTEGHLAIQKNPSLSPFIGVFDNAGLPIEECADMTSVMWSKLLLNLNNPINALSDIPLKEQLSQRGFRRCLALAQQETLHLLSQAGIDTIRLTAVPTPWIPKVMKLPDWLFTRLASRMLAIDPIARSSMWEDLQAGRQTEIDWINGEVVRLAQNLGVEAPVNKRLVELVHQAEKGTKTHWDADSLYRDLLSNSST
ncbi:2-dehydropantoate 2-reductase [Hahella sp. CCB-MM4]|uniref:2-dehydropantoate 2-reductase n=1 Tax=Hahella sp. (strain CCB-MM4) TaxID=1926491 RepID=UPI000B9BD5C2|nr:2-dehydropantoate 2-reductase [Hahella sp. CCB-MM4]OZG74479.1 2-dehydropantoate 2-reductase [Hahella sp. CCB-MM4]